jgi:uncharacterized protein (DUF433 family)
MEDGKRMEDLVNRIEINPQVMLGKPVIRGTRIPVEMILKKLAQDLSTEEILADYPRLVREDVQAALAYAAAALGTEEMVLLEAAGP